YGPIPILKELSWWFQNRFFLVRSPKSITGISDAWRYDAVNLLLIKSTSRVSSVNSTPSSVFIIFTSLFWNLKLYQLMPRLHSRKNFFPMRLRCTDDAARYHEPHGR